MLKIKCIKIKSIKVNAKNKERKIKAINKGQKMTILKLLKYIIELLIVSRQQGDHLETYA